MSLNMPIHGTKPARKKTVLVAGGGIAGMQAALTCAKNGHHVVLCEKTESLGGALKCEENVPFKRLLGEYLKRQASAVEKAGVEIRLGTVVTPELAREITPDVIISAMGAVPISTEDRGN